MKFLRIIFFLFCFLLPSILCWKSSSISPLRPILNKKQFKSSLSSRSFPISSTLSTPSTFSISSLSTSSPSTTSLSSSLSSTFYSSDPATILTPLSLDQSFFTPSSPSIFSSLFPFSFSLSSIFFYSIFLTFIYQIFINFSLIFSNTTTFLTFLPSFSSIYSIFLKFSSKFYNKLKKILHFNNKHIENTWRSCRLISVDPLEGNENYAKFRFEILNKKKNEKEKDIDILSSLNLNGRMNKIVLCREDNFGGLIKREFNPFVLPSYYTSPLPPPTIPFNSSTSSSTSTPTSSNPSSSYPVLNKIGMNEFEIIVNVNKKERESDYDEDYIDSESLEFLKTLEINQELAFKLGHPIFEFTSPFTSSTPTSPSSVSSSSPSVISPSTLPPIEELTIVASEEGIIPIIQLLTLLLNNKKLSKKKLKLKKIKLLWINSSYNSFILQSYIENLVHLSRSLHSPFILSCEKILDIDLSLPNTVLNIKLRDKLPEKSDNNLFYSLYNNDKEYEKGREGFDREKIFEEIGRHLTILSIPNHITHSKFLQVLQEKGNKLETDIISVNS